MFKGALAVLLLAGCGVDLAQVDKAGDGTATAADDLDSAVDVTLPAALGGGMARTHFSPSSQPALAHSHGAPSPLGGAAWPAGSAHPLDTAAAPQYPVSADLSGWAPPAGDQGATDSCQSWATGYTAMGWWANAEGLTGAQFAPMYVYSQISNGACDTKLWSEPALAILQSHGIDTFTDYQPNPSNVDCATPPTAAQDANAARFRVASYDYANLANGVGEAIKATISGGRPAILHILTYPEFENAGPGHLLVGAPKTGDAFYGGHVVVAFSYDAQGVWILNSWGTRWGADGWAELSWAFVDGAFGGYANVGAVAEITGVSLACSDSDNQCAAWAATGQCTANPGYMLAHCCASCANPAPCSTNVSSCGSLAFQFSPFVNASSCLDISQDSSANLTQVQEYACNGTGAQKFQLVDLGGGDFSLRHLDSGKCVDIYRAGTANGNQVDLWPCNSGPAQTLQLRPREGGAISFYNPHSGKCLDVAGGNPADETKVQLWDCNDTDAQKWWVSAQ